VNGGLKNLIMTQQQSIIKYSNEILDYLLDFKKSHPYFTFSLRQRDSVQSKEVKRLESGHWFQGSGYIYVPLFKKGDSARKIKTVGFTVEFDKNGTITDNSIEISFKSGIDNEDEILFHQRLASKIGIELNNHNHGFKLFENPQDITSNLHYFITEVRTQALILLDELGLREKYVISEAEFQKHLHRINEIKLSGLKSTNPINYWIFQGNPKIYNAIDALNNNAVKTWTVSAHKDKIKKGDHFILWLTGSNAGCYALGTVVSEVTMMKEEDAEMGYYLSPTPQVENTRVQIIIDHNFTESPVLWEMIKDDEAFKDFKGSNQGTNFTATEEQYETLLDFDNDSDSNAYAELKKLFDKDKVKSYLTIIRNFVTTNALKFDDPRISFNIRRRRKRLAFLIGNRYTLVIQKKDAETVCCFISKDNLTKDANSFTNQKGEIEAYWIKVDTFEKYLSEINEGLLIELNRNTKCAARKYTNQDFINDVYQTANTMKNEGHNNSHFPLNRIPYGPPGTGKTFILKNEYFSKYTLTENSISPEVFFEETVSNLTWWQVIALALIEIGTNRVNEILENRWVAKKAQLSESKNVRATIWGTLQMHTIVESTTVNYTQRQTPFIFNKTTDKKWELHENELSEQVPELYDTLASVNNFKPGSDKEIKHYVFTTFHQSFSYEDFIEGIKPVMEDGHDNVTYRIENGIFKELCLRAQNDPTNRYAIFIDEINRGNISQIFGELITLIEADKRIGASNEIKVKLPYSKKEFGVPSNIDIYGTMNTADRSVEALDTALRRRFSFVEMMPESQVIAAKSFKDFDRVNTMLTINKRIELLLDRNHTLGHAYFMKNDFRSSFENEIIPLLQEYFYNDYGKIGLVLGKGFVRVKELTLNNTSSIFADFETKNEVDIARSYELIPFHAVDFKQAIETLLA